VGLLVERKGKEDHGIVCRTAVIGGQKGGKTFAKKKLDVCFKGGKEK